MVYSIQLQISSLSSLSFSIATSCSLEENIDERSFLPNDASQKTFSYNKSFGLFLVLDVLFVMVFLQRAFDPGQHKFYKCPDGSSNTTKILFGCFIVSETQIHPSTEPNVAAFIQGIIDESSKCNLHLQKLMSSTTSANNLSSALSEIINRGARFAVVVMVEDLTYGKCKLISNR